MTSNCYLTGIEKRKYTHRKTKGVNLGLQHSIEKRKYMCRKTKGVNLGLQRTLPRDAWSITPVAKCGLNARHYRLDINLLALAYRSRRTVGRNAVADCETQCVNHAVWDANVRGWLRSFCFCRPLIFLSPSCGWKYTALEFEYTKIVQGESGHHEPTTGAHACPRLAISQSSREIIVRAASSVVQQ